jgi:hypothetical protein
LRIIFAEALDKSTSDKHDNLSCGSKNLFVTFLRVALTYDYGLNYFVAIYLVNKAYM